MKNFIIYIFLLMLTFSISAEGFVEIGFMKNDTPENGGVPFVPQILDASPEPEKIVINEIEGLLYYAYWLELVQVNMNHFSSMTTIGLPREINRLFFTNLEIFPLSDGHYTNRFKIFKDFNEIITPNLPGGNYGRAVNIGNYLFYYSGSNNLKGPIRAVSLDGEELNTEEAIEKLQFFTNSLSDEQKEAILPIHEEMLESGNSILVGNRYYTTEIGDLLDYFKSVYGIDYHDFFEHIGNVELLNYDSSGCSYWFYRGYSVDGDYIFCFSPTGEIILRTDFTVSRQTTEVDHNVTRNNPGGVWHFYTVPSGNIYASNTNAFGTILYRYNRTWGDPNMVTLAINGLDGTDYDDYVYEVLDGFTTEELRLQRNMVFALKDYRFSSTDLLEYYGQFNWYDPEKTIEEASAELTDNQLRFVNYIRELEAARN